MNMYGKWQAGGYDCIVLAKVSHLRHMPVGITHHLYVLRCVLASEAHLTVMSPCRLSPSKHWLTPMRPTLSYGAS